MSTTPTVTVTEVVSTVEIVAAPSITIGGDTVTTLDLPVPQVEVIEVGVVGPAGGGTITVVDAGFF